MTMTPRDVLEQRLQAFRETSDPETNGEVTTQRGWIAPSIVESGTIIKDLDGRDREVRYRSAEDGLPYAKMTERQALKMAAELKMPPPVSVEGLWMAMVIMTPALAEWLLEKFCITQRKLTPRQLADLRNEIKTGNWWLTHQGIVFVNRLSKDGQHRLMAIVETGIAVPMMVCFNLLLGAAEAMDQHSKRSAVHQSQIRGDVGNKAITPALNAAGTVVINYSPKLAEKYSTSPQGIVRMLDELRADFFDPIEEKFQESAKSMPHINNGYVKGAIVIRLIEVHDDRKLTGLLKRFYSVLASGEVKGPEDYVTSALSHTLARDRLANKNTRQLSKKDIFLITLKAIGMYFNKEEVSPTKLIKLNNTEKVALATSIGVDPAKFDAHERKKKNVEPSETPVD